MADAPYQGGTERFQRYAFDAYGNLERIGTKLGAAGSWVDRTLAKDPYNYTVRIIMGSALAQRTREFDLDKEEKLNKAKTYADKAIELLANAPWPRPDISDEETTGMAGGKQYRLTGDPLRRRLRSVNRRV